MKTEPIRTARFITTLDCPNKCSYCCNTPEMINSAIKIKDLSALKDYDIVCITGGEPMLRWYDVISMSIQLKQQNHNVKIYLYTALSNHLHRTILKGGIDGVHFTLHIGQDTNDFYKTQQIAKEFPVSKSFRARIMSQTQHVLINTKVWSRLEIKPWIEHCPLPEHETLFIWDE